MTAQRDRQGATAALGAARRADATRDKGPVPSTGPVVTAIAPDPCGLVLDGTSGTYATAPDYAALTMTGVLQWVVRVKAADWTTTNSWALLSHTDEVAATARSFHFFVQNGTGNLGLAVSN